MRAFLAYTLAYAFMVGSAALASFYGFMSSSGSWAYVKAGLLCLVAVAGCHGPAWTAYLRRAHGWIAAWVTGLATVVCLLVTLWGGLGTISSGGAEMRAERNKAADDRARAKDDRKRLQVARDALPAARPAAAVSADITTARSSPLYRATSECSPDQISGPKARDHCKQYRQLEAEHAAALEVARLDAALLALKTRLDAAPPPLEAYPQAVATSVLTGISIELSMALYALLASLALELGGMAAMMVAWVERGERAAAPEERAAPPPPAARRPRPLAAARGTTNIVPIQRKVVFGSIKKFCAAEITPAHGERLEVRALLGQYRLWCKAGGLGAADLERFLDEIEGLFEIEPEGDKVYVLNVRLAA